MLRRGRSVALRIGLGEATGRSGPTHCALDRRRARARLSALGAAHAAHQTASNWWDGVSSVIGFSVFCRPRGNVVIVLDIDRRISKHDLKIIPGLTASIKKLSDYRWHHTCPSYPLCPIERGSEQVVRVCADSAVFAEEVEPTGAVPMELSLERYRRAALLRAPLAPRAEPPPPHRHDDKRTVPRSTCVASLLLGPLSRTCGNIDQRVW